MPPLASAGATPEAPPSSSIDVMPLPVAAAAAAAAAAVAGDGRTSAKDARSWSFWLIRDLVLDGVINGAWGIEQVAVE